MTYQNPPPLPFTFNRLRGKVVFVTGGSSGIGEAAVRLFAREGARVVAAARRVDKLQTIVAELKEAGHEAFAVECDVTEEASVERAVTRSVEYFGRLDGAFNNAGIGPVRQPIQGIDMTECDRIIATNLRAVIVCMKHEVRAMLASGGGAIVNVSSVAGLIASTTNTSYAAAKWGLAGATKCAALDVAGKGIRINAIAPGPTRSEAFDAWLPDEASRERVAAMFPMNYIAHPDDMARAALFLLSEESRWTTGTVLPCEGGKSLS